jgi:hypothetical protein
MLAAQKRLWGKRPCSDRDDERALLLVATSRSRRLR